MNVESLDDDLDDWDGLGKKWYSEGRRKRGEIFDGRLRGGDSILSFDLDTIHNVK